MMPPTVPRLLFATLFLGCTLPLHATELSWPQYRGPSQDGHASTQLTEVFPDEPFGLEVEWRRELGAGYSGVAIEGQRAVTMFAAEEHDVVAAFDIRTGEELWRYTIAETFPAYQGSDGGPGSTPVLVDGTVYGLGPLGDLFALDLENGQRRWHRRLSEEEATQPEFGYSTAPVVVGDLLIVQTGLADGRAVTAVSRHDGETRWALGRGNVSHESPVLTELGGRQVLLAVTNERLLAIAPESGEVLWEHEHKLNSRLVATMPVNLGDGGLMLNGHAEVVVLDIVPDKDGYRISERWRSDAFKRNFGLPVIVGGFAYGMSRRFLTCVDLKDGRLAWRSRPPGGSDLTLVDDHLLVVGTDGELVVAAASPEAYQERARLKLFERMSWTAPSFASGRIFVRDTSSLAALRITDSPTLAAETVEEEAPRYLGRFGRMLREAESLPVEQRNRRIQNYLAEHPERPLMEVDGNRGWAHLIYLGEAQDVVVRAQLPGIENESVLRRVEGTELFYRSVALDPRGSWEYQMGIDFADPGADPANPNVLHYGDNRSSRLVMPEYSVPEHLQDPPAGRQTGAVHSFSLDRQGADGEVRGTEVQVYLPAGYEAGSQKLPLLLLHSGRYREHLKLEQTLDHLIATGRMQPTVVAMVPTAAWWRYFRGLGDEYETWLQRSLLPELERRYRLRKGPRHRAVMGLSDGAITAVRLALHEELGFGRLATQAYYSFNDSGERPLARIREGAARGLEAHMERRDDRHYHRGGYPREDTDTLAEALRAGRAKVHRYEARGGPGASSWRASQATLLEALFPGPQAKRDRVRLTEH